MRKSAFRTHASLLLFLGALLLLAVLVSCGGNGGTRISLNSGTGSVTTSISDPPVCGSPNGEFKNVWVTITRVRAHLSSDADPNASGWVELVDLRNNPKQIDLLSLASNTCLLTQLGSAAGLPPGNYQQIRLYLLSNSPGSGEATPSLNQCGANNGFNCVVLANGATQTLLLSSEAQTGIKIPPGQIAKGGFTVAAGQTVDLNIDFDTCSSIVRQGNGYFRLKPTLRAGEISLNSNSISGRVVDSSSQNPIPNAIVLLEQADPNDANIDRVVRSGVTGANGTFIFCPLPAGTYDVAVAATTTSSGVPMTYNATVTLKVGLGTAMGDIPLVPEPTTVGTTTTTSSPATISGQVTTAAAGGAPAAADINLSALQSVGGGSPLLVTVPLFLGSTPNVATESTSGGGTCPAGTNCANYTLLVPASNPQAGTFSASPPTSYAAPATGSVIYWVNARAFVPMSASSNPGSPNCSPSSLPATFDSTTQVTVTPDATTTQNFTFTGCQP